MPVTDTPGTYWHSLAESQAAGTAWTCRPCRELNPGTYDTCHFCQQPQPDPPAPGPVFVPTIDDMEDEHDGTLVASLGDSDDAIAVTGDKRRALEALDGYYRTVCGQPNLLDDATRPLTDAYYWLDSGHAVFTRTAVGGWQATPAAEDTVGAVGVTWFRDPSGPVPEPYTQAGGPRLF